MKKNLWQILLFFMPVMMTLHSENSTFVYSHSEFSGTPLKIKKSLWKKTTKVFSYEVNYKNKEYTVNYHYGKEPYAEVLDARKKPVAKVYPTKTGTRISASGTTKNFGKNENINPEPLWDKNALELIELDLINHSGVGSQDYIDSEQATYFLVPAYAIKNQRSCETTATCSCGGSTISLSCECGKSAQCVSSKVTRCVETAGGSQECTETTTCTASCL